MTSDQAFAGLFSIVGAGGLSSMMVALFGFLTETRKGRKPSAGDMSITVSSGMADGKWSEIQAQHLGSIAYALTRLTAIREIEAEETITAKDFRDRLETKADRIVIEAIRAASEKPL